MAYVTSIRQRSDVDPFYLCISVSLLSTSILSRGTDYVVDHSRFRFP